MMDDRPVNTGPRKELPSVNRFRFITSAGATSFRRAFTLLLALAGGVLLGVDKQARDPDLN